MLAVRQIIVQIYGNSLEIHIPKLLHLQKEQKHSTNPGKDKFPVYLMGLTIMNADSPWTLLVGKLPSFPGRFLKLELHTYGGILSSLMKANQDFTDKRERKFQNWEEISKTASAVTLSAWTISSWLGYLEKQEVPKLSASTGYFSR